MGFQAVVSPEAAWIAARALVLTLHSPMHFLQHLPIEPQRQGMGSGSAWVMLAAQGQSTAADPCGWQSRPGAGLIFAAGADAYPGHQ